MRASVVAAIAVHTLVIGCGKPSLQTTDDDDDRPVDAAVDASPSAALQAIYDEVDGDRIIQSVKEMSGASMVTVDGENFQIDQRFTTAGRDRFRRYWTARMADLGIPVTPLRFEATRDDRATDELEAVLPGRSTDSYVVIVHYDSLGPPGAESSNPGADDDMSGMAILLETARLFQEHRAELDYTIRFVATDAEELGRLAGARSYASYLAAKAATEGFRIVEAIDDEQTGWSCLVDVTTGCPGLPITQPTFDIFDCSGDQNSFVFSDLGTAFQTIVKTYSPLRSERHCMADNSDHYALWEIGVPTVVFAEHDWEANPHFDQEGNDVFSAIDQGYLVAIARAAITFQASRVGLGD